MVDPYPPPENRNTVFCPIVGYSVEDNREISGTERKDDKVFNLYSRTYFIMLAHQLGEVYGFELTFHKARHNFGTHITLSLGVPIETVGKMMGHMRIETTQLYAKVTDRKVDEDMKRLKAAGMDRTFGLYEEEVIVKKRRRKFGYQLSDNKETTL